MKINWNSKCPAPTTWKVLHWKLNSTIYICKVNAQFYFVWEKSCQHLKNAGLQHARVWLTNKIFFQFLSLSLSPVMSNFIISNWMISQTYIIRSKRKIRMVCLFVCLKKNGLYNLTIYNVFVSQFIWVIYKFRYKWQTQFIHHLESKFKWNDIKKTRSILFKCTSPKFIYSFISWIFFFHSKVSIPNVWTFHSYVLFSIHIIYMCILIIYKWSYCKVNAKVIATTLLIVSIVLLCKSI